MFLESVVGSYYLGLRGAVQEVDRRWEIVVVWVCVT